MKFFSSEFAHSYKNYSFGYCNYVERDVGDKLEDIYAQGYLPYSGTPYKKDIFYMARSARIDVRLFALNSENRRIAKRFDEKFTRRVIPYSTFDFKDKDFLAFCLAYFSKRHGKGAMTKKRLEHILASELITHIVEYREGEEIRAYVFELQEGGMAHFWFSFYDLALTNQSLGMWLMIDCVRKAQEKHKEYYYLGTVYAEKALYKTNFDALEYWNGAEWARDIKKLKERSRSDKKRSVEILDEWKESL